MDTPDLTSYIVDRLSDAVPLNDIVMEPFHLPSPRAKHAFLCRFHPADHHMFFVDFESIMRINGVCIFKLVKRPRPWKKWYNFINDKIFVITQTHLTI